MTTRELRVTHVVSSLAQHHGGPSTAALGYASSLATLGHSVTLLTTTEGLSRAPDSPANYALHAFPPSGPASYKFSWALTKDLIRSIRASDIVHIHSLYVFPSLAASAIARLYGVPYIVRPHGTLNPYHFRRHRRRKAIYEFLFEKRIFAAASAIHYVSEAERSASVWIHQFPLVVGIGISPTSQAAPRQQIPHSDVQLLFVGRLTEKKRPSVCLDVLEQLIRCNIPARLRYIGPEGDVTWCSLRQAALERGLSKKVDYLGEMSNEQARRQMSLADVLVLPSLDENFGQVVLEAAAERTCVVATPQTALAAEWSTLGAARIGSTGQELADQIAVLVHDRDAVRTQLDKAYELAATAYSWDAVALALSNAYEAILRRYNN